MPTRSYNPTDSSDDGQLSVFQQVVNNTQAGLLLARPVRDEHGHINDFQYILTNEYNARLTGRTVAEMTGKRVGDLFPGWQNSDLFRNYVQVVETGESQRITFPYQAYNMNGWFDGMFSRVDGCILYTYTDVTLLKEAELAQQRQAELLERVMNATLTAIVVHEPVLDEAGTLIDFRLTQLNQMAADILGGSIGQIQNQLLSRYFPGIGQTPVFEKYRRVIETGKPTRLELPFHKRWYDLSVTRLGKGLVVVVQEITHMYEYRQKLELANHELKRSNESLQSFAYIASHDLQEPLRKITSFADLLQNGLAEGIKTGTLDIIRRMGESAERMRTLIQDLLAYSQVEAQRDAIELVDLGALVQGLADEELWGAIDRTNAQLRLDPLPVVSGTPSQMRQLFQNLLSNAIKFSQKDQVPIVTVSSRVVSRAEVPPGLLTPVVLAVSGSTVQSFHEISVIDNGIGFEEQYAERIFQVFQRLHGRAQYSGSGIGLAICQKIVERHGGAIIATSTLGVGSSFRVYLPA